MGIFGSIGKIIKKVAPLAALVPGVGTLAAGAIGLGSKALGGAPAEGAGGGSSTWDKIGKIGGAVGGYMDAKNRGKTTAIDNRATEARTALDRDKFGLDEKRYGEDTRQFDSTMGLNRDKLAQDDAQFQSKFGLDTSKFDKEKETEQFGRARNARFAKVRAPLISNLMMGRRLSDDPNVQARV